MDQYRITFSDGLQVVILTSSLNQAIAAAVRQNKEDREIVKVERKAKPKKTSTSFPEKPVDL
jgi:hypothetical protein